MSAHNKLPITEEIDFAYLLSLMPPLHDIPEFAWLPELFSIIGHEVLIDLCKYCGGEYIRIPTLTQLTESLQALQLFYDVDINKKKDIHEVIDERILQLYRMIKQIYSKK